MLVVAYIPLNQFRLVLLAARAKRAALNAQALAQDGRQIKVGHLPAAQKTLQAQSPIKSERLDVLLPVALPDEVEDHVDAPPARLALDVGGEVLRFVVYAVAGAGGHRLERGELVVGAGGDEYAVAGRGLG